MTFATNKSQTTAAQPNEQTKKKFYFFYRMCETNGWMGFKHCVSYISWFQLEIGPETAPADVIWEECICWKLCDRLYSFIFVKKKNNKKKKGRASEKQKTHAKTQCFVTMEPLKQKEKQRTMYVNGKCANKCFFFFSFLLILFADLFFFAHFIYPSIHLSVNSPRTSRKSFKGFRAGISLNEDFNSNEQTNKWKKQRWQKPRGQSRAGQSRVEQNKIASQIQFVCCFSIVYLGCELNWAELKTAPNRNEPNRTELNGNQIHKE